MDSVKPTKLALAYNIMKNNRFAQRKRVIDILINDVGLTKAGASTYYYLIKNKLEAEEEQATVREEEQATDRAEEQATVREEPSPKLSVKQRVNKKKSKPQTPTVDDGISMKVT